MATLSSEVISSSDAAIFDFDFIFLNFYIALSLQIVVLIFLGLLIS